MYQHQHKRLADSSIRTSTALIWSNTKSNLRAPRRYNNSSKMRLLRTPSLDLCGRVVADSQNIFCSSVALRCRSTRTGSTPGMAHASFIAWAMALDTCRKQKKHCQLPKQTACETSWARLCSATSLKVAGEAFLLFRVHRMMTVGSKALIYRLR